MYVYIHLSVILNNARLVSLWLALEVARYTQCILPLLCSPHFALGLPSSFYPRSTVFILTSVCRLYLTPVYSLLSADRSPFLPQTTFYTDWQELCIIYNFWKSWKKKPQKNKCVDQKKSEYLCEISPPLKGTTQSVPEHSLFCTDLNY